RGQRNGDVQLRVLRRRGVEAQRGPEVGEQSDESLALVFAGEAQRARRLDVVGGGGRGRDSGERGGKGEGKQAVAKGAGVHVSAPKSGREWRRRGAARAACGAGCRRPGKYGGKTRRRRGPAPAGSAARSRIRAPGWRSRPALRC